MEQILIADDHPLFRAALRGSLQQIYPQALILEAGDMPQTRQMLEQQRDCELVLLDLHMPGSYGFAGLVSLRNQFPAVATLIISANENPETIQQTLDFGAQGYVSKRSTPDEIATALHAVSQGQLWIPPAIARQLDGSQHQPPSIAQRLALLTPQQHRVLELVAEGLLNKQIADRLNIQERTIKAHVSAILEKLEVRNRTQAGVALRRLDIGDPDQQHPAS